MTILTIILASWNIGATVSSGLSTPGASVFLILNGGALFAFIAAGLAELVSPNARTANVAFECVWTAVFSVLQLGAGIAVTVNSPAIMCQPEASWGVCASSHLLVPVSWLSSFAAIAYSLMLFGTTIAHMHAYPSIWWTSVYSLPWFLPPISNEPDMTELRSQSHSKVMSESSETSHDSFIVLRYLRNHSSKNDDVENGISEPILFPRQSNGLSQPSIGLPVWAQEATVRRGLDKPFVQKEDTASSAEGISAQTRVQTRFAVPQPRIAQPRRGVDQPFARRIDAATLPSAAHIKGTLQVPHFGSRPLSPLQRKQTVSPVFSHKVEDQDSPIPLPKLSEWVYAGSDNGRRGPRR